MSTSKQKWDKYVTPKSATSEYVQKVLDWWHGLPVQNLCNMNNSWVGYLWKYYPEKSHPYHLTTEEILRIYTSEHIE